MEIGEAINMKNHEDEDETLAETINSIQESDNSTEENKRKFTHEKFQRDENEMFWLREELRGGRKQEVREDKDKTFNRNNKFNARFRLFYRREQEELYS